MHHNELKILTQYGSKKLEYDDTLQLFGGLLAALGIFALIGSDRYATDVNIILIYKQ